MNNLKKIITTFIVMIIGIIGICNVSQANLVDKIKSTPKGGKVYIKWDQEYRENPDNLFCFKRSQEFRTGNFIVREIIKIEGSTSSRINGEKPQNKPINAKLAYILSQKNETYQGIKGTGSVQCALWTCTDTWCREVGQNYGISFGEDSSKSAIKSSIYKGIEHVLKNFNIFHIRSLNSNQKNNIYMTQYNKYTKIVNDADRYTQKLSTAKDKKDNTNKNKIKTENKKVNNKEYIKVGPFNWTFGGKLNKISVYDQNSREISGQLYSIYNGSTEKFINVGDITSDKDFYIYVPANSNVTIITKIKGNATIPVKNVKIWFLEGNDQYNTSSQHVIVKEPYGGQETISLDFNYDIRLTVNLSGYVWTDKISGKKSVRNDLFKDNDYDTNDILLNGITVKLIDRSNPNNPVAITTTKSARKFLRTVNGYYKFDNVPISKLGDYYIEFEYDGIKYTNVIKHIEKANGSKSSENSKTRSDFNKNFSVIEGESENTGFTRDSNGNRKYTLDYTIDKDEHRSKCNYENKYMITANTDETGYKIKDQYHGQSEITDINLGLYEREQPDIALVKDIQNVRISINGYNHIYDYSQRFINQSEYGDGFNVGVKFGNKYGSQSYTRPIYKSDYEYIDDKDKTNELKVYITYKLAMKNESTNLIEKVNSVVDYYDARYTLKVVGRGIDKSGNITNDISHEDSNYSDKYKKVVINNNTRIEPQKQEDIYVQFELGREAALNVLNDKENLENVAEINSYSIFDNNNNIYAGIDKDSNPGNAKPEEKRTYQDDTDSAPGLKLEVVDAREMTGKVFLDTTSNELKTGEVRQGNGEYENGETGIEGVKVVLKENTGSNKVYETTTDKNGDFYISGFIPGDYTLTYTWGDKTYTVQNYKGTVYDSTRNQEDKKWYRNDPDKRLNDALDNYVLRENIDNEMKTMTNKTKTTIEKMESTTPTMGIGVEYEDTYTASAGDRYTYLIRNVDFGIAERARQNLTMEKRIRTFKATLGNGQVIADLQIDDKGKISSKNGSSNNVAYMKPSKNANPKNGFLKLELDNEFIQGTTIEVGYEIKAKNNSELDYSSEKYYHYGIKEGPLVTITPTETIDYLDKSWAFDGDKNKNWSIKTPNEIKGTVEEKVYNSNEFKDRQILYTSALQNKKLKPTESVSINLNVSKELSPTDDISLDNEVENIRLDKTGGSKPEAIPGNYVPGTGKTEVDDDMAETVIVTPSTGDNKSYIIPITIILSAMTGLALGIIIIKKKVLTK